MYPHPDLERLVDTMRSCGVSVLEVESGTERLRLVLPLEAAHAPPSATSRTSHCRAAISPAIGTFLPRGGEDGLPGLGPGAEVSEGEVLGYVCQGPVRAIVASPATGVLTGKLPEKNGIFGYGDTVFSVEVGP